MVLYVVGQTPSIDAIIRFITKEWNHVSRPQVFLHEEGYFVVKFASIDDKKEVLLLNHIPLTADCRPMIVKPWTPNFNFHAEILKESFQYG